MNIENIMYEVQFVSDTGVIYDLTSVVTSLQWEEQSNEFARRCSLKLVNRLVSGQWLMGIVKLGGHINVICDWGNGKEAVFWGQIWEWAYASAQEKVISITCYDCLKYLEQSEDYGYFTAGLSTAAILQQICDNWGIAFVYNWEKALIHEKKVFSKKAVSEMILEILEEVKSKTGERYVCNYRDCAFTVNPFGSNDVTYLLGETVTMGTEHKVDLHSLVSRVKVLGNADDEGRSCVEAVLDGNQDFGVLQKILVRDADKCVCDVMAEATVYLQEHGSPEETISVTAVDLPFLRKGACVSVLAGDLIGEFWVLGLSHNGTDRTMQLTLERKS